MPTFRYHLRDFIALAAAMMAVAAPLPFVAAETTVTQGVLVLRNGNVLQGGVRRYGDYYRVDLANASFQVPVAQTELFCQSLVEAYEQRRELHVGASADAHLELARWCLRHDLLDQAAREVLDARTIDPGHPSLGTIDSQLGQLIALKADQQVRRQIPEVKQVTFDSPLAAPSAPAPTPLDISAEAQTQFVRNIQPMLVHSCATGGCHQPDSQNRFQLDRWALEGSGNATLIRRNLAAVAAQVDKQDPASSPLIQWARHAHGGKGNKSSTALAPYQAALLMEWLNAAAGVIPSELVAPELGDQTGAVPNESKQPGREHDEPAAAGADGSARAANMPRSAQQPNASFVPRDPFDPEIFNRRQAVVGDGDQRPATIRPRQPEPTAVATGPPAPLPPAAE